MSTLMRPQPPRSTSAQPIAPLQQVAQQGPAGPEHAAFVARLGQMATE